MSRRRAILIAVTPILVAAIGLWAGARPRAQAVTPPAESFEVASIKPNTSGALSVSGGFLPGGRYRVSNYPLRSLIAAAYLRPQVPPDFLIGGGPAWIDSARFDVDAKASAEFASGPDGPSSPRRVMLQRLLAERFDLRVHMESREAPTYALVMARTDRRPGEQLRPAGAECLPAPGTARAATCGPIVGPGQISLRAARLSQLVNLLPRFVNRVVVDRTGLDGTFDLSLTWTPAPGEWVAAPLPGGDGPPADGPSFFTALSEQLGLKLEAARGPVEVLVVDGARLPAEN